MGTGRKSSAIFREPAAAVCIQWARGKPPGNEGTHMDARLREDSWTDHRAASLEPGRPSRSEAEAAVRTLIRWAGDDPRREGLVDTPSRVVRAYEEWFAGYRDDPARILERCFEEVAGYD